MGYYYIISVECPLSGNIVSIIKSKHDKSPKVGNQVRDMTAYISWLAKLKRKKTSPKLSIIDKIQEQSNDRSESESELLLNYYRWQFKCWGFKLFENGLLDQRRQRDLHNEFACLLGSKIKTPSLEIKRQFLNYKLLILFAKDLCTHFGHSRALDEITIMVILCFIFGVRRQDLSDYTIFELEKEKNTFQVKHSNQYMITFTKYIQYYCELYHEKGLINKVFKLLDPNNVKSNNKKLRIVQHAIGYHLDLRFESSKQVSQALSREYFKNIDPSHEDVKSWIMMGVKDYINITTKDKYMYNDLFPFIYMSSLPFLEQELPDPELV